MDRVSTFGKLCIPLNIGERVELEFILDLSEFIRGSNALHKSKPFVFPVHLLPNGLSFSPDATVIFS